MRRFLENWGLTIAAVCIGLLLLVLFGAVVGCAAAEGAKAAAEGKPGTPPLETTGVNALLWVLGYAVTRDGLPILLKRIGKGSTPQ